MMKPKSFRDKCQQCQSSRWVASNLRCEDFRRRLVTIMLLSLWLLSAAPPLGAQEAAPTWVEAWRVETEGRSEQGAAVTEDRVYVAAGSDLLALDAADGSVIWTAETGETYTLKPIVTADAVFVANNDGTITRLRTEDGTALWQATGLEFTGGLPLVTEDLVYLNGRIGDRGYLVAYDAMTGAERWRVDVVVGGVLTPKVISGTVYTTAADPETRERIVLALDADTGRELWRTAPEEDLRLYGVGPKQIYASEYPGDLVALDLDGIEKWRFGPGEQVVWSRGGPSEVDGVLYASTAVGMVGLPSADPAIFALDAATGEVLWKTRAPSRVGVIYGPVEVDDALAVMNQGTRAPMLLDRQTGEILGDLPALVDDYPVVFEVGADLVVVSYDGSVIALRPAPA